LEHSDPEAIHPGEQFPSQRGRFGVGKARVTKLLSEVLALDVGSNQNPLGLDASVGDGELAQFGQCVQSLCVSAT
jgi:hypothetical protein